MSNAPNVAASFQSVIRTLEGQSNTSDFRVLETDAVSAEFEATLLGTLLPRRVTLRSETGMRFSVIAKNRRIVQIAEVHPANLWIGEGEPQKVACDVKDEAFVDAFVETLLKVSREDQILIEQHLLSDALPKQSGSGFPASSLTEHIERMSQGKPRVDLARELYDAFPDCARIQFGGETRTDVPKNASVEESWLKTLTVDLRDELFEVDFDVRLIISDGEAPSALAIAWLGDDGAVVLSTNESQFGDLEKHLSTLRTRL